LNLYAYKDLEGRTATTETLRQGEYQFVVLFRRQIKLSETDVIFGEWRVADFGENSGEAQIRAENLKKRHRLPGYRIQTAVVEAWPIRPMDSAKDINK
jgi:hypothetical protein